MPDDIQVIARSPAPGHEVRLPRLRIEKRVLVQAAPSTRNVQGLVEHDPVRDALVAFGRMSPSSADEPGKVAADSTRVGIAVLCLFGVAWTVVLLPLSSASTPVAVAVMATAILWAGSLLWASRRRDFAAAEAVEAAASGLSPAQRQRVFIVTNVAQAVVFSVAISICIATDRVGWIPLIAALVVGLHFVPLAWAFGEISFGWAGGVLAVLGGFGIVLVTTNAATLATAVTITSVGSSITLLATATVLLRRHGRPLPRESASN